MNNIISSAVNTTTSQFPKVRVKLPIVIATFILIFAIFYFRIFQKPASLTLSGQASVSVDAQWVSFVVSKVDVSSSAVTAVETNQTSIDNLITYLTTLGTANQDIRKGVYQLTPQTNGKYLVVNTISVKYGNLAKIDSLIKGLYVNGATTISDISYGIDDWSQVDAQARAEAVTDAKAKLNQTAKNLKRIPGKLITIVDDNNVSASETSVGGQPQIRLTKNIVVSYELR